MLTKLISNAFHAAPAPAAAQPPEAAPASAPASPAALAAAPPNEAQLVHMRIAGELLIDRLLAQPALADPKRLERHGWKAYSQADEDGIIDEIFRRIGVKHKSFVEFGCGNGLENNTTYLLSQGWRGLWMDGNPEHAQHIGIGFAYLIEHGLLRFGLKRVTRDNIEALIAAANLGPEIDFLCIDIDGNDYHVWEAIRATGARVVAVEYNAKYRPPHDWRMSYDAAHDWRGDDRMGASLAALTELGAAKGYQLVGCNLGGGNAFFVRLDEAGEHFAAPATAQHLYQPARYVLTHVYHSGHPPNSLNVVEGAARAAGLPWPPPAPLAAISMSGDRASV